MDFYEHMYLLHLRFTNYCTDNKYFTTSIINRVDDEVEISVFLEYLLYIIT